MSASKIRPSGALQKPSTLTKGELQNSLDDAIEKAFNPRPTFYEKATVLMLKFKVSDLKVDKIEKELGDVFEKTYGYAVEYHTVGGSPNVAIEVSKIVTAACDKHDKARDLLILVFSGHGSTEMSFGGVEELWVAGEANPNGTLKGPKFCWTRATIATTVVQADVLQIMDCCCAGASIASLGAEVIAASSATESTSDDPWSSFTNAIVGQLRKYNGEPRTACQLNGDIGRRMREYNLYVRPTYSPHFVKPSVTLQPLPFKFSGKGKVATSAPDGSRIIVKAHVQESMTKKDLDEFKTWLLTRVPASVDRLEVTVEGFFKADSSVILLSLPIEVWTTLKANDAYAFVSIVKSSNLLVGGGAPLSTLPVRGPENIKPGYGAGSK